MVAEQRGSAMTREQVDVPVPQDVEQNFNVPVGVRQQVLLNGDWVTVTGDVAEYTKKLIASVARSKSKAAEDAQVVHPEATKVSLNPNETCKMARVQKMLTEIAEKNDDHEKFYEQFGECLNLGNHDGSTIRVKIAELLRPNASESEDERT